MSQQAEVAGRRAGPPLSRLLAEATGRLADAGVPSARNDVEVLAAQAFGVPRARLPLAAPEEGALCEFYRLVAERSRRVPLQYLTGRAGFHRIEVSVGPGVFVPRPETELLADWAIESIRAVARVRAAPSPTVVDLCAGSGAIALAVRAAATPARVVAVEADATAFQWLRRNAAGRSVGCVRADATQWLGSLAGQADVVVSNPPYLPAPQRAAAPPEVAVHEPPVALWVEGDGLTVLRGVVRQASRLLRAGGAVGVEHADDQQAGALDALRAAGFHEVTGHRDLAGRPRFVTGRWPGRSPGRQGGDAGG